MTMLRKFAHGFTLVELMVVVAIIGLLSSVAIPSFSRYIRRSRTVEATMNLRRLFDSASAYYMSEKANKDGKIVPKQFPTTVAWSPDPGTCCGFAGNKCKPGGVDLFGLPYNGNFSSTMPTPAPNAGWADGRWQALNFSVDEPHYFIYETVVQTGSGLNDASYLSAAYNGTAVGDQYNIEASGDLNCDFFNYPFAAGSPVNAGMSLFRRTLTIDANYTVRGSSGLYMVRELE